MNQCDAEWNLFYFQLLGAVFCLIGKFSYVKKIDLINYIIFHKKCQIIDGQNYRSFSRPLPRL